MSKYGQFENPILNGFYPDPSVCRVGEDYYMVTSSFVYFPGLPIFHSRDLIHWEQIGHGISSPEQLDYKNCETSLGLWAPSIRYHDGTFYIINTFVSEGREARRDNYIITASDPSGPWSRAHFIEGADGIDSSLFFDKDGRMWYAGNYISTPGLYEGHHGIYLCELDPLTFQFKGERTVIWDGNKTRSKWIEAPHIYYENGYYYLIVAEGGTFTNHSVMMARCRTIDGDYEICPRNPVVTHRHLSLEHEISVVGHCDIVETQNGEWWMVLLGVRPYKDAHFNLGRETFLVPVLWESDGWLRIDNENGLVNREERRPELPSFLPSPAPSSDNFESPVLKYCWNTIHPPVQSFYSLTERPGCLRLYLRPEVLHEICTPAFIGRRQQHAAFLMQAALDFTPMENCEEAGLALVQDDRFHYTYTVTKKGNERLLKLSAVRMGCPALLKEAPLPASGRIYLTVTASREGYHFYYGMTDQEFLPFFTNADPTLLSSLTNEGFTGTYLGMYASSNHQDSNNYADFDWFLYEPLRQQ
ncbi:glycoside hydrolase family 43 protein [Murimonas intestini]|uniref:glycoside hydrolase family 43 protein n=1 Tax=Murimonas intestini TaxID=1337051 RepID=UPI0011DD72BE|nr:glycoside hydrolase family 43 protein [Murimonas intestini]